jgi:hypothetical protein
VHPIIIMAGQRTVKASHSSGFVNASAGLNWVRMDPRSLISKILYAARTPAMSIIRRLSAVEKHFVIVTCSVSYK